MNVIEDAYRRFCRRRFPPTTERDVAALEKRLQIRLPDDYRQYLLGFNGGYFDSPVITPVVEGCPEDELELLCGVGDVPNQADLGRKLYLTLFDDNSPPKVMVIGCTPMGSLILLDTAPGEENGNIYLSRRTVTPTSWPRTSKNSLGCCESEVRSRRAIENRPTVPLGSTSSDLEPNKPRLQQALIEVSGRLVTLGDRRPRTH